MQEGREGVHAEDHIAHSSSHSTPGCLFPERVSLEKKARLDSRREPVAPEQAFLGPEEVTRRQTPGSAHQGALLHLGAKSCRWKFSGQWPEYDRIH